MAKRVIRIRALAKTSTAARKKLTRKYPNRKVSYIELDTPRRKKYPYGQERYYAVLTQRTRRKRRRR